jgi:hypothetical protein
LLIAAGAGLNWRVLAIIAPLVVYFIYFSLKLSLSLQVFTNRYAEILHPIKAQYYQEKFSLAAFLSQPSLSFRFSLFLFILTAAVIIGNQPTEFISPVP